MLRLLRLITCSNNICKSASDHLNSSRVHQYEELDIPEESETSADKIVDVDDDDNLLCATMVHDIYNLRASDAKAEKRRCTDYMRKVQKDITIDMRRILIDWLVEVAEDFKLDSEKLYLTVNYIDRYLSGNMIDREKLQLLGVTCMMIASSNYENNGPPLVKKFRQVTANTYSEDEIQQMEYAVVDFLESELTVPTTECFLRRFVRVAKAVTQALPVELECMSNYLAELSLLDYTMLGYAPSMIAASSVFLARYILSPSRTPWNSTLQHYTLYKPSELLECVEALHRLRCNNLNAVGVKYSHHKYMYVAKKYCPPSIPCDYFQDYCYRSDLATWFRRFLKKFR